MKQSGVHGMSAKAFVAHTNLSCDIFIPKLDQQPVKGSLWATFFDHSTKKQPRRNAY